MGYVAVAGIAPQYENYANWWLKAYEQDTTTPLAMALDSAGSTTVAKLELDSVGFINTTGNARVIPYIDELYDAWLIPTEAEADANDLTNAVQVADNILPPDFAGDIAANTAAIAGKANLSGANFTGQLISTAGNVNLKSNTALSDAAATLTAAQLIGGEFTITPTVARIQTTDTATAIIAALGGSVNNSNFDITMINLAAFDVTIAAGTGVTLVGNMVVNDGSATFRVRRLTSSTVSVTRLETGSGSPIFTKSYESSALAVTAAGLFTLAHSLGEEPKIVYFFLECTVANLGYSIGDRVAFSLYSNTSTIRTTNYTIDATNIRWKFTNDTGTILLGNKSTGAGTAILKTSWRLYVRAYA